MLSGTFGASSVSSILSKTDVVGVNSPLERIVKHRLHIINKVAIIAVALVYFIEKKIPYVPLIGAVVISLFGGLTLYFNNPIFIYMKPTIVNLIFAAILLISKSFFNRNFLKFFLQTAFQLNEEGWGKLNSRWAYFFIFLALLNEVVWRTQPEATWVNFKVWGMLPITIIFTAMQLPLINRYKL